MKKKVISLLLASAMTATMLAGCGSTSSSSAEAASSAAAGSETKVSSTTNASDTEAADAINLEDTEASTGNTVTVWTWDYDNTLKMAAAFKEVYPNIDVEVVNGILASNN